MDQRSHSTTARSAAAQPRKLAPSLNPHPIRTSGCKRWNTEFLRRAIAADRVDQVKRGLIAGMVMLSVMLVSCTDMVHGKTAPLTAPSTTTAERKAIAGVADGLKEKTDGIDKASIGITAETAAGAAKAPDLGEWANIDRLNGTIASLNREIAVLGGQLKTTAAVLAEKETALDAYRKQCEAKEKENDELLTAMENATAATAAAERNLWLMFMGFGALVVVLAIPAGYLFGAKIAGAVASIGGGAIVVGKFMFSFPAWLIPVLWGVLAVGLAAVVAYAIWTNWKTICELVATGELMKRAADWSEGVRLKVQSIQSDATIKIVDRVRSAIDKVARKKQAKAIVAGGVA